MSNNTPILPVPGDDDADDPVTKEVDGEQTLDPDADDDLVDSADADRLAVQADDDADDEEP